MTLKSGLQRNLGLAGVCTSKVKDRRVSRSSPEYSYRSLGTRVLAGHGHTFNTTVVCRSRDSSSTPAPAMCSQWDNLIDREPDVYCNYRDLGFASAQRVHFLCVCCSIWYEIIIVRAGTRCYLLLLELRWGVYCIVHTLYRFNGIRNGTDNVQY